MSDPVVQIMNIIGCGPDEAKKAFETHGDVVSAAESLFVVPETQGSKYIPPKREIVHLSPEQKERCDRGRKTCDAINACRKSAYHSSMQQVDSVSEAQLESTVEIQSVESHVESTS